MNKTQTPDPLHGITLKSMLEALQAQYGWDGLANHIHINCFIENPSVKSSLNFLRRTPWARAKVERLYVDTFLENHKGYIKIPTTIPFKE